MLPYLSFKSNLSEIVKNKIYIQIFICDKSCLITVLNQIYEIVKNKIIFTFVFEQRFWFDSFKNKDEIYFSEV